MVRVETDSEKITRLEHDLAQCFKISGADSDGDEDWRIAPHAVGAVRELRNDYDSAIDGTIASET